MAEHTLRTAWGPTSKPSHTSHFRQAQTGLRSRTRRLRSLLRPKPAETPAVLSPDVCLMPGESVVRVEVAPGNARRIFTGIDIVVDDCDDAVELVWNVMTDYEHLTKPVPNLVQNEVVERYENGARLRQVDSV